MNEQRRIVYAYRDEVLEGKDMGATAREEIGNVISRIVDEYTPGDFIEDWDLDGLLTALEDIFPVELDRRRSSPPSRPTARSSSRKLHADAIKLYDAREEELGEELMRALERYLLLQIIDQRWREHLYDMDYLREGIHLRGFAQIEPIVAYKNEAFTLFTDLMNTIWSDFTRMIFNVEVEASRRSEPPEQRYEPSGTSTRPGRVSYSGGSAGPAERARARGARAAREEYAEEAYEAPPPVQQRVLTEEQTSAATTPAGAGRARSSRSATARSAPASGMRYMT